jgi:hypothetical protein
MELISSVGRVPQMGETRTVCKDGGRISWTDAASKTIRKLSSPIT